jgi:putative addiction module antidote
MQILKLQKIGNSVGVTFSQELLEKLNLCEGDTLLVIDYSINQYNYSYAVQEGKDDYGKN